MRSQLDHEKETRFSEDNFDLRSDGKRGAAERASLSTPFYKRIDGRYDMRSRSDHEKATRFLEDDFDIRPDGKREK